MAKATRTYSQWRQEKLTDPERAVRYLNAAKRESREAFLHAVKNVIQARQVTKIAKEIGMARESVYRSFSAEGNPAFYGVDAVMEALDIDIIFVPSVRHGKVQVEPERYSSKVELQPLVGMQPQNPVPLNVYFAGTNAGNPVLMAQSLGKQQSSRNTNKSLEINAEQAESSLVPMSLLVQAGQARDTIQTFIP
ncbi:MAG: addiction module antidote protein [Candidatus Sulfotelmatobacter sp.]|jgi:probable addiction module antidote protein